MKFLRRKMQGTETVREEGRIIHREIEITVEQEWLAVPIPGGSGNSAASTAAAPQVDGPPMELPPATELE